MDAASGDDPRPNRRNLCEEVSKTHEARHPYPSPDDVEGEKLGVTHPGHSRDERREGSRDDEESRQHHRLAAEPLEQTSRLFQMFLFEYLRVRFDVAAADVATHPVVDGVARTQRRPTSIHPPTHARLERSFNSSPGFKIQASSNNNTTITTTTATTATATAAGAVRRPPPAAAV